ncbi:MAG: hypothetical protein M0Z42_25770 [Actinomycetota bacterium]|jgi:hypothetical protein|nr:hypothetical protein [Actinomycetota bacterium]
MPALQSAKVPDPAAIRGDPAQWSVTAWVLVRAVMLNGLRVEDPAVAALLGVLAPVAEAELARARRRRLDVTASSPGRSLRHSPSKVVRCSSSAAAHCPCDLDGGR